MYMPLVHVQVFDTCKGPWYMCLLQVLPMIRCHAESSRKSPWPWVGCTSSLRAYRSTKSWTCRTKRSEE